MPLDPDFLAILRCPETRAALVVDGDRLVSVDGRSRRAYRLDGGDLPILVVEESTVLGEAEWAEAMARARGAGS
ncbi:MAG TPA: hypothetical protein VEI02_00445 [Planctomycetota bacterium]|nr:hypothetical protein [Planctomycetota bacterium]